MHQCVIYKPPCRGGLFSRYNLTEKTMKEDWNDYNSFGVYNEISSLNEAIEKAKGEFADEVFKKLVSCMKDNEDVDFNLANNCAVVIRKYASSLHITPEDARKDLLGKLDAANNDGLLEIWCDDAPVEDVYKTLENALMHA